MVKRQAAKRSTILAASFTWQCSLVQYVRLHCGRTSVQATLPQCTCLISSHKVLGGVMCLRAGHCMQQHPLLRGHQASPPPHAPPTEQVARCRCAPAQSSQHSAGHDTCATQHRRQVLVTKHCSTCTPMLCLNALGRLGHFSWQVSPVTDRWHDMHWKGCC